MSFGVSDARKGIRTENGALSISGVLQVGRSTATTLPLAGLNTIGSFRGRVVAGESHLGRTVHAGNLEQYNHGRQPSVSLLPAYDVNSYPVENWVRRTGLPQSAPTYFPLWIRERNLFIAFSNSANVMVSPDGITWTNRAAAANQNWIGAAWSPEQSIAVVVSSNGGTARIAHSRDGLAWRLQTAVGTTSTEWSPVIWAKERGLFVATGTGGAGQYIMTSPDGYTWTTRAHPAANQWFGVTWAPEIGRFVAVSYNGHPNRVMLSEDGFSWRAQTVGDEANSSWVDVTWSSELRLLVAVANAGTPQIMTSPDGINWTTRATPLETAWRRIIWAKELGHFFVVANGLTTAGSLGQHRILVSRDGIVWETRMNATGLQAWQGIAWAPELNRLVATSLSPGSEIMTADGVAVQVRVTKPSGLPWVTKASAADDEWSSVIWQPAVRRLVAVAHTGTTGELVMVSDNYGQDWSTRSSAADNAWNALIWITGTSRLVAVGSEGTGNRVMTSDDNGDTWITRASSSDQEWRSLAWAREVNRLVAVASTGGTTCVMTSDNQGTTWTNRVGIDAAWQAVAWIPNANRLVAVASSGTAAVMTSDNGGTNWAARTADPEPWSSVVWIPEAGRVVAVASGSAITMVSDDFGTTWSTRSAASDAEWSSCVWLREASRLVAVARSGAGDRVMYSDDLGETWQSASSAADNGWTSLAWVPDLARVVAVGTPQSGTVSGTYVMTQTYPRTRLGSALNISVADKRMVTVNEGGVIVPDGISSFTGAHKAYLDHRTVPASFSGRIAVSLGRVPDINLNDAFPYVELARTDADKRAFGVFNISATPSPFVTTVNAVGEGAIWVCDVAGHLTSGDYVTSSTIAGYGKRQDDDCVWNYTVARVVQHCDFDDPGSLMMRFLALGPADVYGDNTIEISEEEYTARKALGETVYRAAFLGCVYVCG
jgi:hypothetical protein